MLITLALSLSTLRHARRRADRCMRLQARRDLEPRRLGFDREEVLADARRRFVRLQAAWDARDLGLLRSLTTPELFDDLVHVLAACDAKAGSHTDVVSLDARLLGLEEVGAAWLASVEFSGLIRESAEGRAVPFHELWMLAADKGGEPAWRLARQQALL